MNVLHVASFRGNIGDNANHAGFRPWFEQLAGQPVTWTEFEIRDVYRKTRAFDMKFAAQANAADLVVVGGGNYFELWVQDSPTGTSISIPDEVLDAIRTPIFFNALGVDDAQGYTDITLGRFRKFMSRLLRSDQYLVSVRNDGAMASLRRHFADLPLDKVSHLPDGGFFSVFSAAPRAAAPRIGINLAGDMLDQRFPGGDLLSYPDFVTELAEALTALWQDQPELHVTLFPHIFRDLSVYADLVLQLPDRLRRDQLRIAAYDSGPAAAAESFGEYLACDLILAMRFHSNVVPIAHGIPTIGLYCYEQVKNLYDELEDPGAVVKVNERDFAKRLADQVRAALQQPQTARARVSKMQSLVAGQRNVAGRRLADWIQTSRA